MQERAALRGVVRLPRSGSTAPPSTLCLTEPIGEDRLGALAKRSGDVIVAVEAALQAGLHERAAAGAAASLAAPPATPLVAARADEALGATPVPPAGPPAGHRPPGVAVGALPSPRLPSALPSPPVPPPGPSPHSGVQGTRAACCQGTVRAQSEAKNTAITV
jgi:hypothetical protein